MVCKHCGTETKTSTKLNKDDIIYAMERLDNGNSYISFYSSKNEMCNVINKQLDDAYDEQLDENSLENINALYEEIGNKFSEVHKIHNYKVKKPCYIKFNTETRKSNKLNSYLIEV